MAHFLKKVSKWGICSKKWAICSFLVSDPSDSLTITHFLWAPERIAHSHSFFVSDLSDSLTLLSNQRAAKFSILTLRCAVWLTRELDSAVWCTPQSLTLQYDENCGVWLHGVHHPAESDYFEKVRFCVFEFVTSFNYILSKTSEEKNISVTICDLLYSIIFIVISESITEK